MRTTRIVVVPGRSHPLLLLVYEGQSEYVHSYSKTSETKLSYTNGDLIGANN